MWIIVRGLLFTVLAPLALAWHDFTDTDVHCWLLTANANNPATLGSCTGVSMKWVERPPEEIKAEKFFNISFSLTFSSSFWDWAVTTQASKTNFFGYLGITDATSARNWCRNTNCPSSGVAKDNCCIHHVNVHSCPLEDTDFCGPWIKPSGSTYTHSKVLWGTAAQEEWRSEVAGLYATGTTQMIAHVKMADFQIALFQNINVLPKMECGNAICEPEDGESCDNCPADCGRCPLKAWQIALIALTVLLLLAIPITFALCWYRKEQKLLWDEAWVIPSEEVKIVEGREFGSTVSRASQASGLTANSYGKDRFSKNALTKQVFTKVGYVYGQPVAVRDVYKKEFSLTRAIRQEVKQVREIDHHNVCKMIGACIEVDNFCVLTEYCAKGSLNDVLLNFDIPINWAFRFSFASDIARGMKVLHGRGLVHGRLTSNNCIIDDRWTVKVTDYGIPSLRESANVDGEEKNEMAARRRQLYKPLGSSRDSQEDDVYAFGVILVEIATRNEPYGDEDLDSLPAAWTPKLPNLQEEETEDDKCPRPQRYGQLIKECWKIRPSFDHVYRQLKLINPNKLSAVDVMMLMMEKYSKHLESIVADRTNELTQEKMKTDRLLHSMLPKSIADELRVGKMIDAVQYSACTIYFSDIVGFTNLSGKSTPMQVVALLNKLYITFDSIIDDYDVYKVETIGDAYMVVSGVPTPNGNNHAHQVSCMSLDIVAACREFTIPHLPGEVLQIRVGLHTGPVCAGVVGLKMPRYCLFGDTVNTASRMESNGEAYRVHISDTTHSLLEVIGGFTCDARGTIPVKGKGDMKTWWLTSATNKSAPKENPTITTTLPSQAMDQ